MILIHKYFWKNIFEIWQHSHKPYLSSEPVCNNTMVTLIPPSKLSWAPPTFLPPQYRLQDSSSLLRSAAPLWGRDLWRSDGGRGDTGPGDHWPVETRHQWGVPVPRLESRDSGDSGERLFPFREEICCSLHFNSHYRVYPNLTEFIRCGSIKWLPTSQFTRVGTCPGAGPRGSCQQSTSGLVIS